MGRKRSTLGRYRVKTKGLQANARSVHTWPLQQCSGWSVGMWGKRRQQEGLLLCCKCHAHAQMDKHTRTHTHTRIHAYAHAISCTHAHNPCPLQQQPVRQQQHPPAAPELRDRAAVQ